jgi:hypothetical protein
MELSKMEDVQELTRKFSFEENIKFGIEQLGIDKVIAYVGIDKVIASIGIDKVIAYVGIDKVIASVGKERLLEEYDIEQLEAAIEKRKKKLKNDR